MTLFTRRSLIRVGATLTAAAAIRSRPAFAQAVPGPFVLPPLGYAFDTNEPSIDATTMMLHHDRHHAAYVANLNTAALDYPQIADAPLHILLSRLDELPVQIRTTVRNNGGGHVNHTMFWTIMGGKGGMPTGELAEAINQEFGSFEQMKMIFNRAGTGVFGSGWVFVTVTEQGKLSLAARPNQDSPLMDRAHVLFGNDVWEHAYYLKYQNRRADYLSAWWNVLDWNVIAARFAAAKLGTLTI